MRQITYPTGPTEKFQTDWIKLCFWESLKQQLGQLLHVGLVSWDNAIWGLVFLLTALIIFILLLAYKIFQNICLKIPHHVWADGRITGLMFQLN